MISHIHFTDDYNEYFKPGRWWWVRSAQHGVYVVMSCPKCAARFGLNGAGNHTVHPDGKVTASVVCNDCDFHEYVFLDDYPEQEKQLQEGER